ncbi:phosphoadenylylsulfate reductase (thioredoxin) [Hasllibacter halocynthiae]|uniref:Adenosine 5'-phosphosulfate reductase n=1 Tax=Hasllibacter halocynthiae TaxID=595589 RepID=A0A2T0X8P2_9RHOB|nr:phosphoadenylyl-sulfate reductase [Hasllibacter halocynthiae]PRY95287.1 phosphoadenylylsulfate reductase (thioredoxin) [Hasllibacter halocynthiae]
MRLEAAPFVPAASDDAEAILRTVLPSRRTALVSSFGADSAVLLHMVSRIDAETPVVFVDTEMLFAETLAYQRDLAARLGLRDVRRVTPDRAAVFGRDGDGLLHRRDPDACCTLRKVEPLERALEGFDAWITGRRRHQAGRGALRAFERAGGRTKVNPLAHWPRERVAHYLDAHDLPRHPLTQRGFASLGCAPCTSAVRPDEDERAGRWRGRGKTECGIHFENGKAVRA